MSTSEATAGARVRAPVPAPSFLGSEITLVMRRRRNLIMLAVLAAAPVVVGVALRVTSPGPGEGPPGFLSQVTGNGLFLGFAGLVLVTPFFLPLVLSVVSGDAVAGEASSGTLRYLLVLPVSRGRVLAVKYAAAVLYAFVAAATVVVAGMAAGALLFGASEVTLLSGGTIGAGETTLRAFSMALYATVSMAGLAAVGLFVSTSTEVPAAAMATTAAVPMVAQILGAVPQLSSLHPWLLTDTWRAYGDLLRDPVATETLGRGVLTQACYIAVFASLAWARMSTRDVTS